MRLLKKIKKHEMLRRWAIAEVYVEYLGALNKIIPQQLLQLLYSEDITKEEEGIDQALKPHHLSLANCLSDDVCWYLANLEINISEFNKLNTLPIPEFGGMTQYTYQVSSAARQLHDNPNLDLRINRIKEAAKRKGKQVQWSGITLIASSVDGPFTIIEGNGRLISLYQILFLENNQSYFDGEIEVVIGITNEEFKIGYQILG